MVEYPSISVHLDRSNRYDIVWSRFFSHPLDTSVLRGVCHIDNVANTSEMIELQHVDTTSPLSTIPW
jgi:hypothetical protein